MQHLFISCEFMAEPPDHIDIFRNTSLSYMTNPTSSVIFFPFDSIHDFCHLPQCTLDKKQLDEKYPYYTKQSFYMQSGIFHKVAKPKKTFYKRY